MNGKQEKKPLSSRAIEAMKPGESVMTDSGENRGLRIICGNAGTKTFFYRYTSPITKKLTQVKLGNFPLLSLAQARLYLQELKIIRGGGRCPAAELKKKKMEEVAVEAAGCNEITVKEMVDIYLKEHIEDRMISGKLIAGARVAKGQSETRRTLYGDAVRALGELEASKVTRKKIVSLVMEIVERGSSVQAGNVLRELSAAYEYSIGLEKFEDDFANPALLAKASLRQAKVRLTSKRGRRVLSDPELKKFLLWLPGSAFTNTQKNIMRFTLWSACRTGEVCEAKWDDVDLESGMWHLRDTKTGIERYVQLPKQAITYLTQLKLVTGDCLFPSQKTLLPIQQKSLTEQAWHLRKTNRMLEMEHWTPHDLRRTVRTGLSRLGCPSEVAEAALGHARAGILGTYDLHSYEQECRKWLQVWADHLDKIVISKN